LEILTVTIGEATKDLSDGVTDPAPPHDKVMPFEGTSCPFLAHKEVVARMLRLAHFYGISKIAQLA